MGLIVAGSVVIILTTVIVYLIRYFALRHQLKGIPQPRSYPLIGHGLIMKNDPLGFIAQVMGMAKIFDSPRMVLFWIGPKPALMLYSAELLERILASSRHLSKGFTYVMLEPWLGVSLLTSQEERWRPMRKLLTPTFHYDILKDFVPIFNEHARVLVNKLAKLPRGEPVEILSKVTLCTLDVICETSMGKCVNAQTDEDCDYVKAVHEINKLILSRACAPFLWSDLTYKLSKEGKSHQRCLNILHSYTKKVIEERKVELEENDWRLDGRRAFLDLLLEMSHNGQLEFSEIQPEVDTFMFEGHDTTSTGISWALHLIGNHPEIQRKIQAEIDEVLGNRSEVTPADISRFTYLECCIKESLRLYPSVPIITRELNHDEVINGVTIPKGTPILLNQYLTHRDPNQWEDPEKYIPERFSQDNNISRHSYSYVPFSAGSRNCIGKRFAIMEEKVILAWIFRNFTITSCEKEYESRPVLELILRPSEGINITLERRRLLSVDYEN
ncbi:unnamed protein product [Auanema sp. JU1783]|nr:unnamed protein product [Auanema sp. JU1783]